MVPTDNRAQRAGPMHLRPDLGQRHVLRQPVPCSQGRLHRRLTRHCTARVRRNFVWISKGPRCAPRGRPTPPSPRRGVGAEPAATMHPSQPREARPLRAAQRERQNSVNHCSSLRRGRQFRRRRALGRRPRRARGSARGYQMLAETVLCTHNQADCRRNTRPSTYRSFAGSNPAVHTRNHCWRFCT